jgi:alpha-beta hydrolase superfamily lysophospholipase
MSDYIDRYNEFARFACTRGAAVYGHDYLGHGKTRNATGIPGFFADKDGDVLLKEDMHLITALAQERHPGVPIFLVGHSMGSLLSRYYAQEYGDELVGMVLLGTSGTNNLLVLMMAITGVACLLGQGRKPAKLLARLNNNDFNRRFAATGSPSGWISSSPDVARLYDKDSAGNIIFTNRAYRDLGHIMEKVSGVAAAARLPRDLPVALFSGTEDPVGDFGKGVLETESWFLAAGLTDVSCKLYPEARHALLKEQNRVEIMDDILNWVELHLPR